MSEPFLGEIKIVGFNFAPRGWALCDGQLLPISQNQSLFSLFGTYYGGDGRTTFGLPELRGRFPMHQGSGPGLTPRSIGLRSGNESVAMSVNQMPSHNHAGTVVSSADEGDRTDPAGAYHARPEDPVQPYGGTAGGTMAAGGVQISNTGSGQAAPNMPPFIVLNFVVALTGLYPSRK